MIQYLYKSDVYTVVRQLQLLKTQLQVLDTISILKS